MLVNFSEGGGEAFFQVRSGGGEGILKVNRGGGEGFFKLEIERPDQKFLSSIAWPLSTQVKFINVKRLHNTVKNRKTRPRV